MKNSDFQIVKSLCVSVLTVVYRYCVVTDIDDYTLPCFLIMAHCLTNLDVSPDLVIHHICCVLLNIVFLFIIFRKDNLDVNQHYQMKNMVNGFVDFEVSTILLSIIHLGYKGIVIKSIFMILFIYFRIFNIGWVLYFNYSSLNFDKICADSRVCYICWYLGSIPILTLNVYWSYLLIRKALRVKDKLKKIN